MRHAGVFLVAAGLLGCGQGESTHGSDGGPDADGDVAADASADVGAAPECPAPPAAPAATHCGRPWFAGQMTPAASAGFFNPYSGRIAVADFDRDGHLDAVVSTQNDAVNVFMGTGVGTFAPAVAYAVPSESMDVAVGDLDNDGDIDIVAAAEPFGGGPGSIGILLNAGNATFTAATSLMSVGNNPRTVTLADTNRDGLLDIAVTAGGLDLGGIEVFRNLGGGTFAAPQRFAVSSDPFQSPRDVAAGDLDGDGRIDLVAASVDAVFVLRGRANGFAAPVRYAVSLNPTSVTVDDINGDGRPDVLTSGDNIAVGGKGAVAMFLNQNGDLAAPTVYTTSARSNGAVAADTDGDGDKDVVVANWYATPTASGTSVFLNQGNGALGVENLVDTGTATSVALADFDNDGRVDLGAFTGGMVSFRGRGDGSFDTGTPNPLDGSMLVSDVNEDGKLDLLGLGDSFRLDVALGNGDSTFGAPTSSSSGFNSRYFALADLDGDGNDDVVGLFYLYRTDTSSAVTLRGHGDGSFSHRASYQTTGAGATMVAIGDVTGDCEPDIVVANAGWADTFHNQSWPGSTDLFVNAGDGTFGAATGVAAAASKVLLGDVTSDGWADLMLSRDGKLYVLRNTGGALGFDELVGNGTLIALVDLNHDGRLDLVADAVQLGNGDGTFGVPLAAPSPTSSQLIDIDGDGNLDGTNGASILYGRGDGTFAASCCWRSLGPAGDLDGDGLADIAGSKLLLQRCP